MSKVKLILKISYQSKWAKLILLDRLKFSNLNRLTAKNKKEIAANKNKIKIKFLGEIQSIFFFANYIFSLIFLPSALIHLTSATTNDNNITQVNKSQTSDFLALQILKTKVIRKIEFPSTTTTTKENNLNQLAIQLDDSANNKNNNNDDDNNVDEDDSNKLDRANNNNNNLTRDQQYRNHLSIFFKNSHPQQFNTNKFDYDEDIKIEDLDDEELAKLLKIAKSDFANADYRILMEAIGSVPKNTTSSTTVSGTIQQINQRKFFNEICIYITVFICLTGVIGNILSLKVRSWIFILSQTRIDI
jgi:hypothetical protein